MSAGRIEDAILLLEECATASTRIPRLETFRLVLLDAYAKGKRENEFLKLSETELAKARMALPVNSPELSSMLLRIGGGYLELERTAEAELLFRECLDIRQATEPDLWLTFNTQSMLGGALLMQAKSLNDEPEQVKVLAAAESLLVAGYEGMKQRESSIPRQGLFRVPAALDRLIEFYIQVDQPEELAKWQAEKARRENQ